MKLRIDDLAARAGTTSRNIRAYQARGLLPAPVLTGRTGYYHEEHLRRLELIGELQERGFSLEAIRQTLDTWASGGDLGHLIGFQHLFTAPLSDEQPVRTTLDELLERFPDAASDPALIDRAVELGLIERDERGWVVPSPTLLEAGAELVRAGVPLAATLELVAAVRGDVADIAERFVGTVDQHLITPVLEGSAGAGEIEDLVVSLQRLRPVALEVVRPFLAQAMNQVIASTVREHGLAIDEAAPGA